MASSDSHLKGNLNEKTLTGPSAGMGERLFLLDAAIVLVKHKRWVVGTPLLAAVVTAVFSLLLPNQFTSRAVLMPPQQQQSSTAAMLGQLGALAGITGNSLGIKNPNDLYVGMLKSRPIADALIDRFELKELYGVDTKVDARKELSESSAIFSGRDNLIVIEFDDKDPKRAADIANAYVEELQKLSSTLAVTEAGQRRLFFENQLTQAKEELSKAEVELKSTQEATGIVQLDQQGRAMIEAVAALRAQIVAREVELSAMRSYATEGNPEFIKIQQEVSGLRSELGKLERGKGRSGDLVVPTSNIPAAGLEYVRKYRNVKYAEAMFELLARQYEMAKIDEARDSALIQVVERAVPQDKKSKPKRALLVLMAGMFFALVGIAIAFLRESLEVVGADPAGAYRLSMFKSHLRISSRGTRV